jgi:hypothetical protein
MVLFAAEIINSTTIHGLENQLSTSKASCYSTKCSWEISPDIILQEAIASLLETCRQVCLI